MSEAANETVRPTKTQRRCLTVASGRPARSDLMLHAYGRGPPIYERSQLRVAALMAAYEAGAEPEAQSRVLP